MPKRVIGDLGQGGYVSHVSWWSVLTAPVWRWRLKQALKIAHMYKQPDVIKALHRALREHEPMYLDMWKEGNEQVSDLVDDFYDVMESLREHKSYAHADRLRTLIGRLARVPPPDNSLANKKAIRTIARGYK